MSSQLRPSKHRSQPQQFGNVMLSVGGDGTELLARGLGYEHLREMVIQVSRPIVRKGKFITYGGNWQNAANNYTRQLLDLISAELDDNSAQGPDTSRVIGKLYNWSAWPSSVLVGPDLEARWLHCCRVIRVSQADSGIALEHRVTDEDVGLNLDGTSKPLSLATMYNQALCLSRMREAMFNGIELPIPGALSGESVPAVGAIVALGGKLSGYSGFVPGIFEEVLYALENRKPVFLLGGFGGAAEALAKVLLAPSELPSALDLASHHASTPSLSKLEQEATRRGQDFATPKLLARLRSKLTADRTSLASLLGNSLTEDENRTLLTTSDVRQAGRILSRALA